MLPPQQQQISDLLKQGFSIEDIANSLTLPVESVTAIAMLDKGVGEELAKSGISKIDGRFTKAFDPAFSRMESLLFAENESVGFKAAKFLIENQPELRKQNQQREGGNINIYINERLERMELVRKKLMDKVIDLTVIPKTEQVV